MRIDLKDTELARLLEVSAEGAAEHEPR